MMNKDTSTIYFTQNGIYNKSDEQISIEDLLKNMQDKGCNITRERGIREVFNIVEGKVKKEKRLCEVINYKW